MTDQHERLDRLERELRDAVAPWRLSPLVAAPQALRGVELTGAVILAAELGDITRFDRPRKLMSYLGLRASEYSSGGRRRQGDHQGGRRACSAHPRGRAWAYRDPAKVSRHLQLRLERLPAEIQAMPGRPSSACAGAIGNLTGRGDHANRIAAAIAREMAAFAWAIARLVLLAA